MLRWLASLAVVLCALPAPGVDFAPAYDLRGVPLKIASLAIREAPGGLLPLAVLAVPGPMGEDGRRRLDVHVEIEGLALIENNQDPRPRIDVLLYGLDAGGAIVGSRAQAFRLELSEAATTLLSTGVRYSGSLSLPPGRQTLRVLVRNATNDVWGLAELTVPLPGADDPIASPPLVESDPTDWWTVGLGESAPGPARPVLVAGHDLEAVLVADTVRPAVAELRFLRDGAEAFRTPADLSETAPGRFALTAAVPADASQGTYDIHLQIRGPAGEVFPEPPRLEAMIVPAETRRADLTWPGLRGRGVDTAAGGGAGLTATRTRRDENRKDREETRALGEGYRRALGSLDGSSLQTVTALIAFETGAIEGGEVVARIEKLRAAELRVAESVADRDPMAMIPLLTLHQQLYRAYRDRQLPSLVAHSRLHAELLAERLAERARTADGTDAAALALTALGGTLQVANLPQSSRRLLFRALEHDPDLLPARLGLARSYERFGQLGAALQELEQLVLDHPDFLEGRLRHAVTLARLGRVAPARPLLEELLDDPEADRWIRSLAAQELARMDLAEGRFGDALDRLDAAIEAFPPDGSTLALRAHVLDRRGRPAEAFDALDAIEPSREPEPRWTYDAWPIEHYRRVRDELQRRAETQTPALLLILGGDR